MELEVRVCERDHYGEPLCCREQDPMNYVSEIWG